MNTIETRLADALKLLSGAEWRYKGGMKKHALSQIKDACAKLLVVAQEVEAELAPVDEVLLHCCGHCGYECQVNELKAGACPRCGTLKDGVLVIAKPCGHCVTVENNGVTWRV